MAKIGFWGRVGNLWRGFLSIWISDIEKKHPEIAYENAINSMVEKYTQLKRATAAIIRRRDDVSVRLTRSTKELHQVENDLRVAIETDQQDLGMILIQKEQQLSAMVAELRGELEDASKDAESAKAALLEVQSEIKKLRAERDNMLAKLKSAEVKVRIQEQLEGLSVDNEVKALENVRSHIHETIAQAKLGQELAETDIDQRLRSLRQKSGDVTARSEWERLRAASASKATQKTL
jgi:phage shock protein A